MSKLKYIIPCILFLCLLLLLFMSDGADSEKISISQKETTVCCSAAEEDLYLCSDDTEKMKKVASSGVLQMYLDEKTLGISILDTISGKLWSSLPGSAGYGEAANLKLTVIIKGREYILNSQSDSLAMDCAAYDIADDGTLTLFYSFRKSLERGKKLDITVPVVLTLADGSLSVKTDCSKIENNSSSGIYIGSLEMLPYLGACSKPRQGDYILLPSASGVIMDISNESETVPEILLPVYGEDPGKNAEGSSFVPLGAFGIKSSGSALVCLIDSGEAIASVKAQRGDGKDSCSSVGAVFEITSCVTRESALYLSKNPYKGSVGLTYRFLNSDNADYITMAGACREILIRQGMLTDTQSFSGAYPFNLSLIGSTEDKGITTSDDEAQELLTALITKGIGSIRVMLRDTQERDAGELSSFAVKNGLSLYLCRSLFSYGNKADTALSGEKISSGLITGREEKNTEDIIGVMREYSAGVVLTDCGSVLPGSYGKFKSKSRQESLEDISDLCTAISSHGSLALQGANIYTLKYADAVLNIPESSPLEKYSCCSSVPFLQGILHGICDYSFTVVNLSDDPVSSMLRAIEYGAVPHYEWYFGEYEREDNLHYMNSLSQARLIYENMKKLLGDLRDQRITAHEIIKENLSRTVYSSGAEIYVNYSDKAISVGGITVDPCSFLRVN